MYFQCSSKIYRFQKNFVPISRTPEFLNLTVDDLEQLLRRDSINVDSEKQVRNYGGLRLVTVGYGRLLLTTVVSNTVLTTVYLQVFDAVTNWMEEVDDRTTYAKRWVIEII